MARGGLIFVDTAARDGRALLLMRKRSAFRNGRDLTKLNGAEVLFGVLRNPKLSRALEKVRKRIRTAIDQSE